jgi:hypothetical protein
MPVLTKLFGLTTNDFERNLAAEPAVISEISEKILLMQANAAAQQHRPICRGTHAKGVCARAQFEVLDVSVGRDPALAARLARGIYARPGTYPAIVRFANADPNVNSDFKADVRALSFSVVPCARNEHHRMRPVAVADVLHERKRNCEQNTLLDADRRHRSRGEKRHKKFAKALAPDVPEALYVDHSDVDTGTGDARFANRTRTYCLPLWCGPVLRQRRPLRRRGARARRQSAHTGSMVHLGC